MPTDTHETTPELTVILTTAEGCSAIRSTLTSLAAQTIARQIELLIVSGDPAIEAEFYHLLQYFNNWRVFTRKVSNVDVEAARTVTEATAEYVSVIEDHAYPEPEWAEVVVKAFESNTVAVGSVIVNGNPGSWQSWCNMLIAYGNYSDATPDGPIDMVAMHNCVFRTENLKKYGDSLPSKFNREAAILHELRSEGREFRFQSKARIRHLNPSSFGATLRLRFDAGRLYASSRAAAEHWHWHKRIIYSGLGSLIPFLRYFRERKKIFPNRSDVTEQSHGLAFFAGLLMDGGGQIVGFVAGPGKARERLATFEMNRFEHLNTTDLKLFTSE